MKQNNKRIANIMRGTLLIVAPMLILAMLLSFMGCNQQSRTGEQEKQGQAEKSDSVPATEKNTGQTETASDASAEKDSLAEKTSVPSSTPVVVRTVDTQKLPEEGIIAYENAIKCPTISFPDNIVILPPALNADGKNQLVINELNMERLKFSDNYQLARDVQLFCIEDRTGSASEYACGEFLVRKYVSGQIETAEYAYFKTFRLKILGTVTETSPLTGKLVQKVKVAVAQAACAKADVKEQLK